MICYLQAEIIDCRYRYACRSQTLFRTGAIAHVVDVGETSVLFDVSENKDKDKSEIHKKM